MNIIINRIRFKSITVEGSCREVIDGNLYIDGQQICNTTENAFNHIPAGTYSISIEKCKIKNRNIPAIIVNNSYYHNCDLCQQRANDKSKESEHVFNVINHIIQCGIANGKTEEEYTAAALALERTLYTKDKCKPMPFCPQIKSGNGVVNLTNGSILVGRYLQPGVVIKSRSIFDTLYERIRKSLSRNITVTLTITENGAQHC